VGSEIMDKKLAWNNFLKTGEINDYLEFCKCRSMEENTSGKKLESEWNNNIRK
jgi:hypothetical protein